MKKKNIQTLLATMITAAMLTACGQQGATGGASLAGVSALAETESQDGTSEDENGGQSENRTEDKNSGHIGNSDDTGKNEEKHKDIKECLRALHRTECRRVPSPAALLDRKHHQVLDRRQNIHKNIGAKHSQRQQKESNPAHCSTVSQRFNTCLCHTIFI